MPFQIIRNDITKVKADAIVNTANPRPVIGRGTESAIYNAAGRDRLLEARKAIGELKPGTAAVTPAFDLDAKFIIHVCGTVWNGGDNGEADILKNCYRNALSIAVDNTCSSIAFPLLSTGSFGYPAELGLQIAVDTFTEFLEEHEMEITLVVFDDRSVKVSGGLADEVKSFVDDSYVAGALNKEYTPQAFGGTPGAAPGSSASALAGASGMMFSSAMQPLTAPFIGSAAAFEQPRKGSISLEDAEVPAARKEKHKEKKAKSGSFKHALFGAAKHSSIKEESARKAETDFDAIEECTFEDALFAPEAELSLEDTLKSIYTESFEKHLQQLINKKGLKNSEVYATANISKQYFSKLLKGQVKPSKEKVLALAIGLRLNLDETVDFLRIAGYALSPISQTDAVVRYFILHEDYNVIKIDIVLFDYGLDPLSKN